MQHHPFMSTRRIVSRSRHVLASGPSKEYGMGSHCSKKEKEERKSDKIAVEKIENESAINLLPWFRRECGRE